MIELLQLKCDRCEWSVERKGTVVHCIDSLSAISGRFVR